MPVITARNQVLELYAEAAERRWVVPCFCSENLTTTEAVLAATKAYGEKIGRHDLPITLAICNQYHHRTQSAYYTHTRRWDIGLRLFVADIGVLTAPGAPFARLRVMVHMDHTQHNSDRELLDGDLTPYSSIMYDASALPFEKNLAATRDFMARRGREIVVEGACDEIVEAERAEGQDVSQLTTPERGERFLRETGVDFIVANLGTEHRAGAADLTYHGGLARQIKARVGQRLVLHGCSSVTAEQVARLFDDGICKVNIWTALERDTAPLLFEDMLRNAAKVAGEEAVARWHKEGLLGPRAELKGRAALSHFATCHRQQIIFEAMQRLVMDYLALWYRV